LCDFLLRRIQGEPVASLQRVLPCELRYMGLPRVIADKSTVSDAIKLSGNPEPVPNSTSSRVSSAVPTVL
jgi:LacI family transcriptional regulator